MHLKLARLAVLMLSSSLLPAQAPVTDPTPPAPPKVSAAEQLFRDAWWAESGANDLDAALRGYLAAVAADGASAVKARALLFAGRLQQRQGQADAALATFRRLVTEYATETTLVDQARGHLRELTSVDLRQNYDEWYERRLFSEEVQLVVLGKIEALAGLGGGRTDDQANAERLRTANRLVAELRAFGKGAVPGLRKAALSAQWDFANTAIDLLFDLGEVPPLAALVRNQDWAGDSERIRRLFEAKAKDRLPEPLPRTLHARGLAAALQGADAVVTFVLGADLDAPGEYLSPWVGAVLPWPGPRARLLAALHAPGTALAVREAIEQAFVQASDQPGVTAAEWQALSADPLRAETRDCAIRCAARALRAGDAAVLDSLLAQLVDRDGGTAGHDARAVVVFAEGLNENPRVELLPWTTARLRAVLVALPANPEARVHDMVTRLRRTDATRSVLAATLAEDPAALVQARRQLGDDGAVVADLGQSFGGEADSADEQLLHARRWHAALADAFGACWPKYDDAARLAAVLVLRAAANPFADRRALLAFLTARRTDASAPVQQAIDVALEVLRR